MSPGRCPGWLARRGPTQIHIHTMAVGSGGRECPKPPGLRPWLAARAVVQAQPLPAFTTSGMPMARKGSKGKRNDGRHRGAGSQSSSQSGPSLQPEVRLRGRRGRLGKPAGGAPLLPDPAALGNRLARDPAVVLLVPANGVEHEPAVGCAVVFEGLAADEVVR